jgi:hypothetical protein
MLGEKDIGTKDKMAAGLFVAPISGFCLSLSFLKSYSEIWNIGVTDSMTIVVDQSVQSSIKILAVDLKSRTKKFLHL